MKEYWENKIETVDKQLALVALEMLGALVYCKWTSYKFNIWACSRSYDVKMQHWCCFESYKLQGVA